MINPSSTLKTSAIEVGDIVGDGDVDNQSTINKSDVNKDSIEGPVEGSSGNSIEGAPDNNLRDDSFGGYADELEGVMASNSDEGIMPLAVSPASVTFSIGGAGQNEVVETGVDETAYRSHTVSINISNAEDYYLMISGQPTLNLSGGSASLAGITGSNVTGANIPAGQWGYGWDSTGTKSNDAMTYTALPSANTKIDIPALTNNAVNFTGKLNFAAKFPNNATLGNYTSSAMLTLIVTPKANTGSATWRDAAGNPTAYEAGTGTMQGISEVNHGTDGGFCKNNSKIGEGWTVDLQDNRGTKPVTYTIVKLKGNCWMAENLSLTGPVTLTVSDTDLKAGSDPWPLPASMGSGGTNANNINTSNTWDTSNVKVTQVRTGDNNLANWKKGYGNYYSWCAATAGTCLENGNSISSKDAASSICPKGWRLPPNAGTGSYKELSDTYSSGWQSNQTINGTSGMYGFRFGYNNPNTSSKYYWTNFWPAAGGINNANGVLSNSGSNGYGGYWSRAAYSSTDYAYRLVFNYSGGLGPQDVNNRYIGYSVRCVASY